MFSGLVESVSTIGDFRGKKVALMWKIAANSLDTLKPAKEARFRLALAMAVIRKRVKGVAVNFGPP